jgi:hypothetical protein
MRSKKPTCKYGHDTSRPEHRHPTGGNCLECARLRKEGRHPGVLAPRGGGGPGEEQETAEAAIRTLRDQAIGLHQNLFRKLVALRTMNLELGRRLDEANDRIRQLEHALAESLAPRQVTIPPASGVFAMDSTPAIPALRVPMVGSGNAG